jgi:flagellar basal body-associated protein FliL
MGPARSSTGWSSGSLIAIILAVLIVALAVAYGINS